MIIIMWICLIKSGSNKLIHPWKETNKKPIKWIFTKILYCVGKETYDTSFTNTASEYPDISCGQWNQWNDHGIKWLCCCLRTTSDGWEKRPSECTIHKYLNLLFTVYVSANSKMFIKRRQHMGLWQHMGKIFLRGENSTMKENNWVTNLI